MISILLCAALGITTLAGCGGASRRHDGGKVNRQQPLQESKESAAPESTGGGGEPGEALWQRKRRLTEAGKP